MKEAADMIGIGQTKCDELVQHGEIRSIFMGGSGRVPTASLEEWVAERDEEVRELGA